MGALVRHLGDMGMHPFVAVFYRNFIALILLLPWLIKAGGPKILQTSRKKMYVLRASVGVISMYFWFYALMNIPLSDAMALSFTAPIFTAILAVVFFKEKVDIHRTISLAVGLAGVLVILRPGSDIFMIEGLYAIIAALLWANTGVMIKTLTKTDSPRVVVFYMVLMMTPLSLPMALPYFEMPSLEMLFWIFLLGLTSNFFQISLSNSFAITEVSVVLPFDYLRLIFVSVIAHFAFAEDLDGWTYAGAAVIMLGSVYSAYQESLKHKYKREMEYIE